MSMVIGSATVVVVEHKHSAMHCDAYKGKLEAVLQMIDRGDIGGGAWYGCDLHKEALAKVEQQIAETRTRIAEMEAEEAGASGVTVGVPTKPRLTPEDLLRAADLGDMSWRQVMAEAGGCQVCHDAKNCITNMQCAANLEPLRMRSAPGVEGKTK